ncbi:GNAT family N-acetyltransferase [Luteimonas notoginsengisoli]
MLNTDAIRQDEGRKRFTVEEEGSEAFVEYAREGDVLVIVHTIVPKEMGGRGIAGRLVEAALQHAREHGLKVRPDCSYAEAYLRKHPEHAGLLAPA